MTYNKASVNKYCSLSPVLKLEVRFVAAAGAKEAGIDSVKKIVNCKIAPSAGNLFQMFIEVYCGERLYVEPPSGKQFEYACVRPKPLLGIKITLFYNFNN